MLDGNGNKIDTRMTYDQVICAWMHEDRSLELSPLPLEWAPPDYRGVQIVQSRREQGFPDSIWVAGAHIPTNAEVDAVVRAAMLRRVKLEISWGPPKRLELLPQRLARELQEGYAAEGNKEGSTGKAESE